MARTHSPCTPEFRWQMIELVRAGRDPADLARQFEPSAQADAARLMRIRTIQLGSRETCGSPRLHAELRGLGERHSRKRIARLMRQAGLVGASHRRGGPVRMRRDQEARPAPDLVATS